MFHALVAVKQVPDTTNIRIDPDTGNLVREGVPAIMNPYDAHALASAVEWKRKLGGKVTVVSMGPPSFTVTIREAIELGADQGFLISDRKFAGADTLATSYVLATVIEEIHKKDPVDVVFFGKQAIDGDTAQVGPGVAVRMDLPIITYAINIRSIDLERRQIVVERKTERWTEVVEAPTARAADVRERDCGGALRAAARSAALAALRAGDVDDGRAGGVRHGQHRRARFTDHCVQDGHATAA